MPEKELETLLLKRLRDARAALASVESCTGGRIASRVTGVAGSSDVFWGSLIAYDNSAKVSLAGLSAETLERHGAVSSPVAEGMARGGLERMKGALALPSASIPRVLGGAPPRLICVSTTGIAGPGGGTKEKPVGLCWIGVAVDAKPARSLELREPSSLSRDELQERFTEAALRIVLQELEDLQ